MVIILLAKTHISMTLWSPWRTWNETLLYGSDVQPYHFSVEREHFSLFFEPKEGCQKFEWRLVCKERPPFAVLRIYWSSVIRTDPQRIHYGLAHSQESLVLNLPFSVPSGANLEPTLVLQFGKRWGSMEFVPQSASLGGYIPKYQQHWGSMWSVGDCGCLSWSHQGLAGLVSVSLAVGVLWLLFLPVPLTLGLNIKQVGLVAARVLSTCMVNSESSNKCNAGLSQSGTTFISIHSCMCSQSPNSMHQVQSTYPFVRPCASMHLLIIGKWDIFAYIITLLHVP